MIIRDIVLEVDGIKIVGQLYLPDGNERAPHPTVCVCHGIPSGNPPDPDDEGYPGFAKRICQQGFGVFIFNFRGTGASGGNLDILGWTRDLGVAIDYLYTVPEVDNARLPVLGFSGGAAVSVYAGSQDKRISAVIGCACLAEFTFLTTLEEPSAMVEHMRNIGAIRDEDFPPSIEEWLHNFRVISPIECVARIAPRPLLLVHGDSDESVHVSHAHWLYTRAGEPKQLAIIEGAGHRLRQNEEAMTIVTDWLKSRYYN